MNPGGGAVAIGQEPVYVDWSHLGESGNEMIAKRIANDVLGVIPKR